MEVIVIIVVVVSSLTVHASLVASSGLVIVTLCTPTAPAAVSRHRHTLNVGHFITQLLRTCYLTQPFYLQIQSLSPSDFYLVQLLSSRI